MKVLLFSAYYLPGYKGGGPIKTVANLINMTFDVVEYKVVTGDRDLGDTHSYSDVTHGKWNCLSNCSIFYLGSGIQGILNIILNIFKCKKDIVYLNSFFSVKFSFIPLLIAKAFKRKVVIGPRGEFSKGALSLKFKKKNIYIKLYKILRLHKGIVFQASSEYEAEDIRRILGPNVDVFIAEDVGAQDFASTLPARKNDMLSVVFISRISPMKNLLGALEMLKDVKQPMLYHIYGPIEDLDYWSNCKSVIKTLPPHVQVEYKGELTPDRVVKTLAVYDVFFMPTKGEAYGHVIAEALCSGLPILIADTTPWRNLQKMGIGWDLPLGQPEEFSATLDKLAVTSIGDYQKMRETVLAWAKNKFSQRDAIEANIAMFRYANEKS